MTDFLYENPIKYANRQKISLKEEIKKENWNNFRRCFLMQFSWCLQYYFIYGNSIGKSVNIMRIRDDVNRRVMIYIFHFYYIHKWTIPNCYFVSFRLLLLDLLSSSSNNATINGRNYYMKKRSNVTCNVKVYLVAVYYRSTSC